jgi:hypothetical protein
MTQAVLTGLGSLFALIAAGFAATRLGRRLFRRITKA